MFMGVCVRPDGWGPSVTQTLTSVSAVPGVVGPSRCVRISPDPTGVSVKQDTTKLLLAHAQVCFIHKTQSNYGPRTLAVTRLSGVRVRLSGERGGWYLEMWGQSGMSE